MPSPVETIVSYIESVAYDRAEDFVPELYKISVGQAKLVLPDRLISGIEFQTGSWGCWIWLGFRGNHGYGQISWGNYPTLVHRLVYDLLIGVIPTKFHLDHLCYEKYAAIQII